MTSWSICRAATSAMARAICVETRFITFSMALRTTSSIELRAVLAILAPRGIDCSRIDTVGAP
ncbi:MAG TPA: hypothetical protein VLD85_03965 [Anaeromyxobacteraceae bacterium]|nr:hypothetical protein [Anaeromyxobacteraceae bacterium]